MKTQVLASAILTLVVSGAAWSADAEQTGFGNGALAGGHGNGQLREKLREKVLAKFDANHDGKIDGDEVAAVKAALQKWRETHKGQGRGHRQFGGQQNGGVNKASEEAPSAGNATNVDVRKAIDEDSRPAQVGF
jgi:hypothetical protein